MITKRIYRRVEFGRIFADICRGALCIFVICLFGCMSASTKFDHVALNNGVNKIVTSGSEFQHVIYEKTFASRQTGSLNVYIGSDGTPWNFDVPAEDPTPRNPLTLRLMMQDPQPAILVGRPCYHGLSASHGCNPSIWTSARYSRSVVRSMADVIERYVDGHSYVSINLIGYSGGGALAALVAAELDRIYTLITVAANLDTDAWTRYHKYEPLFASLNPANEAALATSIRQVHYFGALDSNVPMSTTDKYFSENSTAERREIADFDHVCCWTRTWGSILPDAKTAD